MNKPPAQVHPLLRAWRWVGYGLLLTLAACSSFQSPQTQALLAQAPLDLARHVNLGDVPFHPQTERQCGPAALATVLGATGQAITPEQLSSEVFLPERGGSLQLEMLAAARRHGVVSTLLPPNLSSVLREVQSGHPVLVLLNLSLPIYPLWHYAVVVGHDLDQGEVILRSGQTREQRMSLFTFEQTWKRSGQWAFVALPPGQLPSQAEEAAVVDASVAFERSGTPEQAALAYRTAWDRWPHDAVIGMGLGNSQFRAGLLHASARTFEQVARTHDSAAAWNNLAHVRQALGQHEPALEAARHALLRAQNAEPAWLSQAQATLTELNQAPH